MIRVNLLPPEYRRAARTPIGRFVALLAGISACLGAGAYWGYVHFFELAQAKDQRDERRDEASRKQKQREYSESLQAEIAQYEQRRKAIQAINRNRTLWSRKLDQFFDVVTGRTTESGGFDAWLDELDVPLQRRTASPVATAGVAKKPADGGAFSFKGRLALERANDALARNSALYNAIRGPEADAMPPRPSEFFADFVSITNPGAAIERSGIDETLTPKIVAEIKYDLKLRPPEVPLAPGTAARPGGR